MGACAELAQELCRGLVASLLRDRPEAIFAEEAETARSWLQRMRLEGLRPDLSSYKPVLQAFASKGDTKVAEELWQELSDSGDADDDAYCMMLQAYCAADDAEGVKVWVDRFEWEGIQLNWPSFTDLLRFYLSQGDLQKAFALSNEVALSSSFDTGPSAWLKQLEAAVKLKDASHAEKVARSMTHFGYPVGRTGRGLLQEVLSEDSFQVPEEYDFDCHDNLTDGSPAHWTGDEFDWVGLVRVDGQVYRWLGRAVLDLPAAQQLSREVHPTTTRYIFQAGAAQMTVAFMTASFNHDTALLEATSPVTTMSFSVTGTDDVEIYFDLSAATATQKDSQEVTWQRNLTEQLQVMRVGTTSQKVCGQTSDRIDWGFRYLAIPLGNPSAMVSAQEARAAFVNGTYSRLQDEQPPRKANDRPLALSVSLRAQARVHLMLDEVVSQRFFGTDLRPLWQGRFTAETLLNDVEEGSLQRMQRAEAFDHFLLDQLQRVGGQRYGEIGALVYRQVMGATSTSFNDKTGEAWPFMKEISSDGDVSTVDVIFPAFPLFLHVAPEFFRQLMIPLRRGMRTSGMEPEEPEKWRHPSDGFPRILGE
ncbi:unnamed protein product [Effrenium voratum]|uniref:Uncharacterized protein n=1 Tax=Effrenium voratum TaxID=2562239 RepID=A0AA36JI26_9DINO|nr:unnamed protein product [Effrenium voratum]